MLGKQAHIFIDHERSVSIVGYDQSKGTLANNMKTVSGALAYDNPILGTTVIIVVHQAIHVPTMDCNLICPMQVRMHDVKLDDKPKFLTEDPTDESHAISCDDNMGTLVDRVPSTTPGAEPPRDAKDSGSARSHSMHLETSSSDGPKMVTYTDPQTVPSYMSVNSTRRTLSMPDFTCATHAQPSLSNFP